MMLCISTTRMYVYFSQISTLWPLMTERANISLQEMQREGYVLGY